MESVSANEQGMSPGAGTAGPADYPASAIPLMPVLSFGGLRPRAAPAPSAILTGGERTAWVTSGRVAIAMALRDAGLRPGEEVLVPAYHCESMVSPVRWLGLEPVFFQVDAVGRADLADIEAKLSPRTRVLLVTHYFGMPQDLGPLRALCDAHGMVMIEDCAHALYGRGPAGDLGGVGDYAVASLMKFFPVFEGGALLRRAGPVDAYPVRPPGKGFTVKGFVNSLERAAGYRRLKPLNYLIGPLARLKDAMWRQFKQRGENRRIGASPVSSDGGYEFDPVWVDVRMTRPSQAIIGLSDQRRLVVKRLGHYRQLEQAFRSSPGARPLFSEWPESAVPLVFPLFVDMPERIFPVIKRQGVPVWRFGEYLDAAVTEAVCPNSLRLSRHVFQLPCHQELSGRELRWMIDTVRRALEEAA